MSHVSSAENNAGSVWSTRPLPTGLPSTYSVTLPPQLTDEPIVWQILRTAFYMFSNSLNFYAHEIRHADLGSSGHTTGCELFPLPTGPVGCDATYDVNNLGGYGVQFWLESSWALGLLNIGIGCAPSDIAQTYAKWDERSANNFRARFVTNIPPAVVAPTPFGGPCLR
jgi:hypothetical protein